MKRLNQPEDVANAVVFLASDKAATITGQTIVIDLAPRGGGLLRPREVPYDCPYLCFF